ncbi:MAG TPA: PepSY-associated TM helix domain-containing protein [Bordetella sp.]
MTTLHFRNLRLWTAIHKWSSLVCTLFLLVICLTGLPLVFSEEIHDWQEPRTYADLPAGAPNAGLDALASAARGLYPSEVVTSMFVDDDEPQVYAWMAPSFEEAEKHPKSRHFIRFDARTAQVLEQSQPLGKRPMDFMDWMLRLHMDLFADLPGELFLAVMALLFVIAIVSGAVLYGPFMKKLDFGTVRAGRSRRLRWLDLHNLLGIVTLAWTFVVGATGLMNELSTPLFGLWQRTDVRAMLAPWQGKQAPALSELVSPQAALETAQRAAPGTTFTSVVFPGDDNGSPHHYLLWGHGSSALTSRLFTPVLVDARSGELTAVVEMPWYLRALEVSRPLHFGDYGGLPLKILWAALDLITIVVLASGLYLWFARRQATTARRDKLAHGVPATTPSAMP